MFLLKQVLVHGPRAISSDGASVNPIYNAQCCLDTPLVLFAIQPTQHATPGTPPAGGGHPSFSMLVIPPKLSSMRMVHLSVEDMSSR